MITVTIEELIDLLDLENEPGKIINLKLLEERQVQQAINDSLEKKSQEQLNLEAGLQLIGYKRNDLAFKKAMAGFFKNKGLSNVEIGKKFNVSEACIRKWLASN